MKITVVGVGPVGTALTRGFLAAGHQVSLAARSPREGLPAPVVPLAGAAEGADLTVLAVPFDAVAGALDLLAPPDGAVLVDATNPFGKPLPAGYSSGAAVVAAAAPRSRVVKAFNVLGAEHMTDPTFPDGTRALLPVAGDDPEARATVADLARSVGFDAVEVGGLDNAHLLEEAARYWGLLAFGGGLGRNFALTAAHRPSPAA
jgi:predicted dinucleotide-binding enzyme